MAYDDIKKYESYLGEWKIKESVGKGSFGEVYKIVRDNLDEQTVSALKVIHIPERVDLENQRASLQSEEAVRRFFIKQVNRIKEEIVILQNCRGQSNIVNYEDHIIIENKKDICWDILIRMEYLESLPLNMQTSTQYDVVKMWADILNALSYCESKNIIHRDIKPANILYSPLTGNYKLSDFGTARKNIQGGNAFTRAGTERYMAPEVYKGFVKYEKKVDYYSLGCVIYFYLNKMRHVFMPPYPQEYDADDSEQSERKRLSGIHIPDIPNVSKEINRVLQKSMAYRPQNRYGSARELYQIVAEILYSYERELKNTRLDGTKIEAEIDDGIQSRMIPIILAGVLFAGSVGGIGIHMIKSKPESEQMKTQTQTIVFELVDSNNQTPIPSACSTERFVSEFDHLKDGDRISVELTLLGWILTNEKVGDIEVWAEFNNGKDTMIQIPVEIKDMKKGFDKKQSEYSAQIVAAHGYDVKTRVSIAGVPEGNYILKICARDTASKEVKILRQVYVEVGQKENKSSEELALWENVDSLHAEYNANDFIQEQRGEYSYSLGIDIPDGGIITAKKKTLVLTGWANLPEDALLNNLIYVVDGTQYTKEMLAKAGGRAVFETVPRNLTDIDAVKVGNPVYNSEKAGLLLTLSLPFLERGKHDLTIAFNIGLPNNGGAVLEEIQCIKIELDCPTAADISAEQKKVEWASAMLSSER